LLAVLLIFWAGATHAAAAHPPGLRCAPDSRAKATVLLLHPGGWVMGNAWMLDSECKAFARHGFEALSVAYPLHDYFGALRATERAVRWRRGRRVYAVGWSAGGNMSAMLAVRGQIAGAVAVAAPTNLLEWQDAGYWRELVPLDWHERRLASPIYRYRPSDSRLLLLHSPQDTVVPYAQSVALARRTGAKLVRLTGDHLDDHSALRRSLRWVEREAARR
jgi:acetyl esterase/lipase